MHGALPANPAPATAGRAEADTPADASAGRLYRRLWRWHFYAAFLVIPFVLLQAITGTMYLWHEEWADWAHPELRFVTPTAQAASLDAQVAAAAATQPHATPTTVLVPDDPRRATQLMFGSHHDGGGGLPFPVFVDPYSGAVLGTVTPWRWMPGWTRQVHGGWPLGDAGSWLLELGACWAMVMILTGLYLWWPRGIGFARALLPRWNKGRRVLVRDLHACVAVWFSLITLVFLVTALPWTQFWGNQVLKPIQRVTGQVSPFGASARAKSTPLDNVAPMGLDEAVRVARAQGVTGALEIKLADRADAAQSVRNRLDRASAESSLAIDRYSREVLVKTTWDDYPAIPRFVSTGVDLHEGTFFGRANQWFNTLVSVALVWVSVTGFISWWMRRPKGRLGAPQARELRLPRWVLASGGVLCVLLPMLGASVLALWLAEKILAVRRTA